MRLELLAEVRLPAAVGAPGLARLVVADHLTGVVSQAVLRDATLLATELVTNSVRHSGLAEPGSVTLRISLGADTVRLEIEDSGLAGTIAARRPDRKSAKGGFGLELVGALAARWGVVRSAGTTVWVEMARS
jgi:anti-sigma regulatory factor (Ser/Thr protein kinase)